MSAGSSPEPTELIRWKLDRIRQAGTHIMGRVSYEEMGPLWQRSGDAYAAPMNDIPKVVFSKTLKEASWPESSIASGDLHDEVLKLKSQPGGEIIAWGGAGFAQSLSKVGLIDEYVILTRPIPYGGGKPLFKDLTDAINMNVLTTNITTAVQCSVSILHAEISTPQPLAIFEKRTRLTGADRRRLKASIGIDSRAAGRVGNAIAFEPVDLEVADDSDAHPGHVQPLHRL